MLSVLHLLARCGFDGRLGVAALAFSCTLNITMGLLVLRLRGAPWLNALQVAAVIGYTATAAVNMPELTLDHCGPLVKNLPVLALIVLLWFSSPLPQAFVRGRAARTPRPADRVGVGSGVRSSAT